ncbi:hypothetical protein Tco_0797157 [Tanacetum coccineum]
MENVSLTDELERYKERVKQFEERQNVNLSKREKLIDSQMDDVIRDKNAKFAAFQKEIDIHKQDLSNYVKEKESLSTNLTVFKTESKEKESKQHAYWLPISSPKSEQSETSHTPVKIEVPIELPKVSLVNTSLQKLEHHLASFDKVVKVQTTPDATTEDACGFEHTKAVFMTEIIPFLKNLKDIFNVFDKNLIDEITKVQMVFNQMEAIIE